MERSNSKSYISNTKPLYTEPCHVCGFILWNPIISLAVSDLSLYNDARFKGRSILALRQHYDSWSEIEPTLINKFIADSQTAVKAIQLATGCARVNIALLGNTVSHIHLHLIPRYPKEEANPNRSPWSDPRPQIEMGNQKTKQVIEEIKKSVSKII